MAILKNKHHDSDPVWHLQLTMVIAIILQLALPNKFLFGSRYLIPFVEALLLVALSFTTPKQAVYRAPLRRLNVFLLVIVTAAANFVALGLVAEQLLQGKHATITGHNLIIAAVNIFLTNIILFGLLYWELDGGGPGMRRGLTKHELDFWYPQQQIDSSDNQPRWHPTFVDYLYVSATNGMAFSPTDTMPVSRRAKVLMLVQATVSLVAIALVASRAVNILT
ncbi:MAG: hypothetical protein JWS12_304 [Candidatus Saccharibacteria bacterium]|nr:hypothetical protein [Candidatus Saccharibacteria bacterium]